MLTEMSRRSFLIGAVGVTAAAFGLTESQGIDRAGNRNDLRNFLAEPFEGPQLLRESVANLLELVGKDKTSDLGFAHNTDTLEKFDEFMVDERRQVAELDCRINKKGLYVAHNKGGKSDIDPITAYDIVVSSPNRKALKYDFKEADAIGGVLDSIDPDRPCILNADLYHNTGFNLTPEAFVEQSEGFENALLSIGRKGDFGNMEDFIWQFAKLAYANPKRDFILPAPLIDFMNYFDELKKVLEVPNTLLMVYRTRNIALTQRHVNWIKGNFTDDVRRKALVDV